MLDLFLRLSDFVDLSAIRKLLYYELIEWMGCSICLRLDKMQLSGDIG